MWDGRFQPFHRGHLAVIKAIRAHFRLPLVVMIIQSSEEPASDGYSRQVNQHHLLARNPLTLWERRELIRLALEWEGLQHEVTLLGIPRPDLHWAIARQFYPRRRFICLTGKDDYERAKAVFWASLGEETRLVPTQGLPAVSATAVKQAIKTGEGWEDMLPSPCLDYFRAIEGPRRFAEADL